MGKPSHGCLAAKGHNEHDMKQALTINDNLADFTVAISDDAYAQRKNAIEMGQSIVSVANETQLQDCIAAASMVHALVKGIDAAHKEVKAPILAASKQIDETRRNFNAALELEKTRLDRLATVYVTNRDAEARKAREAELALIAQETAAESSNGDIERLRELAQRKNELTVKPTVTGALTRETWEYEVLDLGALYAARPDLVAVTPCRALILAAIQGGVNLPGLRVYQETKVRAKA